MGCKRDLRDDPETLEALRERGMTTVSYQQVKVKDEEEDQAYGMTKKVIDMCVGPGHG